MTVDHEPREELTPRELAIARRAAKMAIEDLSNEAYRQVGKSVVARLLTWVGMLAVAAFMYAVGKGWVTPK